VVGDNFGFQLGARLGREWLLHHGRRFGVTPARLARAERFFERHGPKAVFVGRFVGFARALVPFVAGTSRMPYHQFLAYNTLGAVLWTATFVLLGYLLGASWRVAEQWIGRGSLILGIVAGAVLLVLWRRRRVSSPGPND
jgi:undecaprenyl-diphosphatase